MSTYNYNLDMERMEAREKIKRLEWELACEKEWTEKLQKIAREHYNNYKDAEQAIKERDEARKEAKELRSALEDISEYLNFKVCSDSMTGDDYKQRIIVAIDHLTNHLKGKYNS